MYTQVLVQQDKDYPFFRPTDFSVKLHIINEAFPGVLGNRGKRVFISGEQRNKGNIGKQGT